MATGIYTSLKLKKSIKEFVSNEKKGDPGVLGDWTAGIFHVTRKKCMIVMNRPARYVIVLPNLTKTDLKNFSANFNDAFYSQLIYDGIVADFKKTEESIGAIQLLPTDNHRSSIGSLNDVLRYFEDWKQSYVTFENMPFMELSHRINTLPNAVLKWEKPSEIMKEKLYNL